MTGDSEQRPEPIRGHEPRTEGEWLARQDGTFTLEELYAAVAATDLTSRSSGEELVHGISDLRWKRRLRGALQTMRRQGRARREAPGVWVIDGPPTAPRRMVLVTPTGCDQFELRLATATELLASMDEPADLILTDPPYGLGVGAGQRVDTGHRTYGRDHSQVVAGYVDVPPDAYRDFTTEWVHAAAAALRPGGHLAIISGPQQAAWIQVTAEDAGLTYVNSLAVGRVFALYTRRRFAHAHWRVTVLSSGPLHSPTRVFTPPADLPKARSGRDYPLDHWPIGDVGRRDARPGELRYPNGLPERLVDRLLEAFTRPPGNSPGTDLVVDPFVGGGTTTLSAWKRGLRFVGGDTNPQALVFTAGRLTDGLLHRSAELEQA